MIQSGMPALYLAFANVFHAGRSMSDDITSCLEDRLLSTGEPFSVLRRQASIVVVDTAKISSHPERNTEYHADSDVPQQSTHLTLLHHPGSGLFAFCNGLDFNIALVHIE